MNQRKNYYKDKLLVLLVQLVVANCMAGILVPNYLTKRGALGQCLSRKKSTFYTWILSADTVSIVLSDKQ